MPVPRLLRVLRRTAVRVLPPRLHTRSMAATDRVLRLSPEQRAQLAMNLARIMRPNAV